MATEVLPDWLDQVPNISFLPEKELLSNFEAWALEHGWTVTDGSTLPHELRQRTDVLLENTEQNQRIRLAVLPKSRKGAGAIRLDANLRTLELLYRPKERHWRVEVGGIRIADDLMEKGWEWLVNLVYQD